MKPDDVCEKFSDRGVSLRLDTRTFQPETPDEPEQSFVLIEGDAESLRFLGELLIAQSSVSDDCHFFIHPSGPGTTFFLADSKWGLSIHRLPCDDGPM